MVLMFTLATSGELRWTSSVLGAIVFSFSIWPTIAAMRMAGRFRYDLRTIDDTQILRTCLSYDFREAIAAKLQAVGGIRVRWAAPWLITGLSSAATLILLALLDRKSTRLNSSHANISYAV